MQKRGHARPPPNPTTAPRRESQLREVQPAAVVDPPARFLKGPRWLLGLGIALLAGWMLWWGLSAAQQPLPFLLPAQPEYLVNRFTYVPLMPFLGLDFHHNYVAVRSKRQHGDPYAELRGDPMNDRYTYPPLTLTAFSWTSLFPPGRTWEFSADGGLRVQFAPSFAGIFTWMAAIVTIISLAAWKSWRVRGQLELAPLPLPFVVAATLASYPVIFELERANCNALPLLAMMVLVRALGWRRRLEGDVLAGLCVAVAAGIKPYGIVLLLGLAALRRFRALAMAAGWLAAMSFVMWRDIGRWLAVAHVQNQIRVSTYLDYSHSLICHWQLLWRDLGLPKLALIPAQPVVGGVLFIVILTVGWRVFRAPAASAVAWPFLLWLAAMATMVSPVAQDYNLLFIPLAVLSAWSVADSWRIQFCVCLVLLWWQPFYIGLANLPWLLLKITSVILTGILIVRRLETSAMVTRVSACPAVPA